MGNRTRVKVVKNKVAPPFREAEFDIMYGQGISREGGVLDPRSSWTSSRRAVPGSAMTATKMGQGRDNAKEFLRQNPRAGEEIAAQVMANADKLLNSKIGRRPAAGSGSKAARRPRLLRQRLRLRPRPTLTSKWTTDRDNAMKITDISVTKKGRYALFVDGEFLFSAEEEALVRSGLRPGMETDIQTLEALRRESGVYLWAGMGAASAGIQGIQPADAAGPSAPADR